MMKWLASLAGPLLAISSVLIYAADEGRLWLPAKYQNLHSSLVKAVSVAEGVGRCAAVVEGTLDLEQSTAEHPIFRILCRQTNGRTYNEMVDGLGFVTLTTSKKLPEDPNQFHAYKRAAWQQCRDLLMERTRLMLDLVWLIDLENPVEPEVLSAEALRFSVPFDARSAWHEPLHYLGECISRDGVADVSLGKR